MIGLINTEVKKNSDRYTNFISFQQISCYFVYMHNFVPKI